MAQPQDRSAPRKTKNYNSFSTMASQNERYNVKDDEFFWLENIMRTAPHKLHSVPGPRSIQTFPLAPTNCPNDAPGPQVLPLACCYNYYQFGHTGGIDSGMFSFVDSAGNFWATISITSGFGSGPYPIATPTQTWYLLENNGAACSVLDITGSALSLPGGATAGFQATQTPQGGTCGKSDERSYLLTLSSISVPPVISGFPFSDCRAYFGESSGVSYIVYTFPGHAGFDAPGSNAWCKFDGHFYAPFNQAGLVGTTLNSWPIPSPAGTFQDLEVACTVALPGWDNSTMGPENILMMQGTATKLYCLVRLPTDFKIYQLNRSDMTHIQNWSVASGPSGLNAPWGFHVFSDTMFFLAQNTPAIGTTIGYFRTNSLSTTVIGTIDITTCTPGGNPVGPAGQSAFFYSCNFFYISYSGFGLGVTNVAKVGPLLCPANPTIRWETC